MNRDLLNEFKDRLGGYLNAHEAWSPLTAELAFFYSIARKVRFSRLVEMGCFRGFNTRRLQLLFPLASIVAYDKNDGNVSLAGLRFHGVSFIHGRATRKNIDEDTAVFMAEPIGLDAILMVKELLDVAPVIGVYGVRKYAKAFKQEFPGMQFSDEMDDELGDYAKIARTDRRSKGIGVITKCG